MAKGKAIREALGIQGQVGYETAGQWDFIYRTSTVKDPKYDLGDQVELPDGRKFRYALSGAACVAGYAANFFYQGAYTGYTALGIAMAIGDRELTNPAATHAALLKDELKGGYIILFQGGADLHTTVRGIIGNDAADANAAFKIQLDAAVTYAYVASTSATEVYRNPYADIRYSAGYATAGVPATYVDAASKYFWIQRSGITWAGSAAGVGGTNGQYGVYWAANGSLVSADNALAVTVPSGNTSIYAGVTVTGSNSGDGPLLDMPG